MIEETRQRLSQLVEINGALARDLEASRLATAPRP